jgi:hypothetical protein
MEMRIVVATDGRPEAMGALRIAHALASPGREIPLPALTAGSGMLHQPLPAPCTALRDRYQPL